MAIRADDKPGKDRVRISAWVLTTLALVFYFGFIALTYYRHH